MIGRWRRPVTFTLVIVAAAQVSAWAQAGPAKRTNGTATPEQIAAQVLESVAERANGFDPPMRAAIEFLIGRTYERTKPGEAEKHLVAAYDIVRYLNDRDQPGIEFLQGEVVAATAAVAPAHVEQMLPGTASLRDMTLNELVKHYIAKKNFEHAIELFDRMETEPHVSLAAERLMMSLGPSRTEDRTRVFAQALNTYRAHDHPYITAGAEEDLGTLVVRFWRDLPAGLVHEAIDELLKQARPENAPEHSQVRKAGMSATGAAGTVAFRSLYEFRLFQLVPILRAIDAPEAERLVKDARDVQQAFDLYPEGEHSLDPTLRDTPLKQGESRTASLAITAGQPPADLAARREALRRSEERIEAIAADAADHPQQALANAAMIPDPSMRARAYLAIAAAAGKNTSVATTALKKGMEAAKETEPANRVRVALEAGQRWLSLRNSEGAESALNIGMAAAREMYLEDDNPDNPNIALKLYWPSTHAWRDLIAFAARIAPNTALDAVKGVPDEEIRAAEEIFLAGIWMKVEPWHDTSPMVAHKGG